MTRARATALGRRQLPRFIDEVNGKIDIVQSMVGTRVHLYVCVHGRHAHA
jgi:hypothetical protein